MKIAGKILKILLLLIIIGSAILITGSYFLRDQVAGIVLGTINKNISTKIDIGSFRLSLLKKFPKASLELENIYVLSSPGFVEHEFVNINTDTLLVAARLSVDFSFTDIISKNYDIDRIELSRGKFNIYTDSSGNVNYNISSKTTESDSTRLVLNLQRILLNNMNVSYNNLATSLLIEGSIEEGRLSSRISGNKITLGADANLVIDTIRQGNIILSHQFNAGLKLKMEDSDKSVIIREGTLSVEEFIFRINGSVSSDNNLGLEMSGENIDLSKIGKYLPENYQNKLNGYSLDGKLQMSGKITGLISSFANPHIEIKWQLDKGSVLNHETGMVIREIGFNGSYSNGKMNRQNTAFLTFEKFNAKFGSGVYSGDLLISNLSKPTTQASLKGSVYPGELGKFFRMEKIFDGSGSCDIDLRIKTGFWSWNNITVKDIPGLHTQGSVNFNNLSLNFKEKDMSFNNIYGECILSKLVTARTLKFIYKGQRISVNGDFANLPEWLTGYHVRMTADADISFDKLFPQAFLKKTAKSEKTGNDRSFSMPADLLFDINLQIDSLMYEKFPASEIKTSLTYKPGILTFNSLNMKSLDGTISGNGFIAQNANKTFLSKGIFEVADININKTLIRFRNFGQNFIKAENLAGDLTGSFTLLLPMDSSFNSNLKSVVAEGRYNIINGALINFEPVKELSSFIEVSELENIRFDRLENDFFIRNNFLYIPQMEVNSTAADLSVNGKHSFDNVFEYHVKIKLSELLSKNRKKIKRNNTEFGVVQDDGLGRTSIFLKIENKGDDIKVSYDAKAAGEKVKSDIRSERKNLKTILNQEYGLFKSDGAQVQKQEEKKPRFKIKWDESDSTKNEPDPGSVKKENALKSLLKKK